MNDIAPDSVPARLALVVGRLNRRLLGETGGLSHALLSALATVAKHKSVRLVDLARVERVSAPSMTRIIAELEYRNLVTRSVDAVDRRASRIEITANGTDAILRARAARAQVVAGLLSDLTPDEIARIEAALPSLERVSN